MNKIQLRKVLILNILSASPSDSGVAAKRCIVKG